MDAKYYTAHMHYSKKGSIVEQFPLKKSKQKLIPFIFVLKQILKVPSKYHFFPRTLIV